MSLLSRLVHRVFYLAYRGKSISCFFICKNKSGRSIVWGKNFDQSVTNSPLQQVAASSIWMFDTTTVTQFYSAATGHLIQYALKIVFSFLIKKKIHLSTRDETIPHYVNVLRHFYS